MPDAPLSPEDIAAAIAQLHQQGHAQPNLIDIQQHLGRGTINQIARLKQLLSQEPVDIPPVLLQTVTALWQQMCDVAGGEPPTSRQLNTDAWGQETLRLRSEQLEAEVAQLRENIAKQTERMNQERAKLGENLAVAERERNTLQRDVDNLRSIRDRLQHEVSATAREIDGLKRELELERRSHERELKVHFEREALLQGQVEQMQSAVQRADVFADELRQRLELNH